LREFFESIQEATYEGFKVRRVESRLEQRMKVEPYSSASKESMIESKTTTSLLIVSSS
jgi:hypothetical protein